MNWYEGLAVVVVMTCCGSRAGVNGEYSRKYEVWNRLGIEIGANAKSNSMGSVGSIRDTASSQQKNIEGLARTALPISRWRCYPMLLSHHNHHGTNAITYNIYR